MILLLFPCIFLVLVAWHFYFKHAWSKELYVRLNFDEISVYAGDDAHITEVIENRKILPLPVAQIAFSISKNLVFSTMENTAVSDYTYKQDIYALSGRQRITRKLTVSCRRRGHYDVHKIDCRAVGLLYKYAYTTHFDADTELYVYAKRVDVSRIHVACEQMLGDLACSKRLYEDPFAFASIREYTPTDAMKSINWKASAKTGSLMVNTFESTQNPRLMIYLDINDEGIYKAPHLIEESISIAATLSQKLILRGMASGIAVGSDLLRPSSGQNHLIMIEQLLAALDTAASGTASSGIDFSGLLDRTSEDCVYVIISKNQSKANVAAIRRLLKHHTGLWVLPVDKGIHTDLSKYNGIHVMPREVSRA